MQDRSEDAQNMANIARFVSDSVADTKVTDIHTHIYSHGFGKILLSGVDELLTYHYLQAETLRWIDMPYSVFMGLGKREQADLVWQTLFVDHSPISEACLGVLTTLDMLGLDVSSRDLESYRRFYEGISTEELIDRVLELANVDNVVMTNDPFDDMERPHWLAGKQSDSRFHAALRLDCLLNDWQAASGTLAEWGYHVSSDLSAETCGEVRRFLTDWSERTGALYMAVSLPPTFAFPEDSSRGWLIEECVLPVAIESRRPFAMMIGVKKRLNPEMCVAGDGMGRSSIEAVERLCLDYPEAKFLVTMLSRENQHELCVAARKFRNLHPFGCWWFLNNPSLVAETTWMRTELLGLSYTPQHSDARVLDQVIYKWAHSREVITSVLMEKYLGLCATGWQPTEAEIRRDAAALLGGNFWEFVKR